ncbi:hypothetical protein PoB_003732900 [Plakobranchus ocellatus]|uniref:Uncharacterized protein n=1 Tax=Plakobranchus ocellatus TaxID=259542 RepID=A0AAV4AWQ9_9GAST|nr:hypothetical protein PoB_003732900 [Plakobranchus ocellatus]
MRRWTQDCCAHQFDPAAGLCGQLTQNDLAQRERLCSMVGVRRACNMQVMWLIKQLYRIWIREWHASAKDDWDLPSGRDRAQEKYFTLPGELTNANAANAMLGCKNEGQDKRREAERLEEKEKQKVA